MYSNNIYAHQLFLRRTPERTRGWPGCTTDTSRCVHARNVGSWQFRRWDKPFYGPDSRPTVAKLGNTSLVSSSLWRDFVSVTGKRVLSGNAVALTLTRLYVVTAISRKLQQGAVNV